MGTSNGGSSYAWTMSRLRPRKSAARTAYRAAASASGEPSTPTATTWSLSSESWCSAAIASVISSHPSRCPAAVVGPDQHKGDRPRSQRSQISVPILRSVEDGLSADCTRRAVIAGSVRVPHHRLGESWGVQVSGDIDQYLPDFAVLDGLMGVCRARQREPVQWQPGVLADGQCAIHQG